MNIDERGYFKDSDFAQSINWQKLAREYQQRYQTHRVKEKGSNYQYRRSPVPILPDSLQLRAYQRQAVVSWLQNKGRGTLKMATGSGKTIIALAIATELYQQIGLQVLLIVCPYRHLVTQWQRECRQFNLEPILAMNRVRDWQGQLSTQLYNVANGDRGCKASPNQGLSPMYSAYSKGNRSFVTVITTNSTLITPGFQSQLKFFPAKTLIVGDEAHNLGASGLEAALPRNIGLRLALSATPERHFDQEGTEALLDYFGAVIPPEFTLADAITQGALVPYLYYPLLVQLTPDEAVAYAKLTHRIGWALSKNPNWVENQTLTTLLTKRARLIGCAANKLTTLKELMATRLHTRHTLFYCGDGEVENYGSGNRNQRQIEAVTQILGKELGYRVNTYTTDTPLAVRERLRSQFERGELQGLVAIRCLDEGIDIPAIKTAIILASSSNPRQFIQRRGRILRPFPGKEQATLFDTIVLPPNLERETWEVEKNLLRQELTRLITFAQLANNADEAINQLLKLSDHYDISPSSYQL